MKTVAIIQSCYIPWKGYFDIVNSVDEFVLYDDRQFTRRDWRNRNLIKTARGLKWLTVPVKSKGRYTQRIDETEISDDAWAENHWRQIADAYRPAPHFDIHRDAIEATFDQVSSERRLSAVNAAFIRAICDLLEIRTPISWSTDYDASGSRTERLVSLCTSAGATTYVSGPSARAYLDESLFRHAGIDVRFFDYGGYPTYEQLHPPFEHGVTILDVLFNLGREAPRSMKSFGAATAAEVAAA